MIREPHDDPILVTATDRRYSRLTGVMLASLAANGGVDWPIAVLGYGLSARDIVRLRASAGSMGARLSVIAVARQPRLEMLPLPGVANNPVTYFKLVLPDLLPDHRGRIVYVDCDTVITDSLLPLGALELGANRVAAAADDQHAHPRHDGRFAMPADALYVNAGLLVLDAQAWRADAIPEALLAFLHAHPQGIKYADQDALNAVLAGRALALPSRWNRTTRIARTEGIADAAILHFTGVKPWSRRCRHPGRDEFLRFEKMTPWRGSRREFSFELRLRKSLQRHMRSLREMWRRHAVRR